MGGTAKRPFQFSFTASFKIDVQGSRVTSGGGSVLVRELDERFGFGELIPQQLSHSRRGKKRKRRVHVWCIRCRQHRCGRKVVQDRAA